MMCELFLCKVNLTLFDELIAAINNYYEDICTKQTVTNCAPILDPLYELKHSINININRLIEIAEFIE